MSYEMNDLLELMVDQGASDLHIQVKQAPTLRISGSMTPVDGPPLTAKDSEDLVKAITSNANQEKLKTTGGADFGFAFKGQSRFRVSVLRAKGAYGMVLRQIPSDIFGLSQIGLPDKIKELISRPRGLILVTGPTGSGKSTTLASMVNWINEHHDGHIITVEDPIEYFHEHKKCIVTQREVGVDVGSFSDAIRGALRQDPDVVLIGEMRDKNSIETALQAAETGHLVFGSLHASNAQQAIQRLFEFFPEERRVSLQRQVAYALRATITQKLLPALEGGGRFPVSESFILDSLARKTIMEGDFEKIEAVIEANEDNGSMTFNQDLFRLVKAGKVTREDALSSSPNPRQLEMNLKGIFLSSGGIVS
jgi:twitching motility protein PilT